jgi:hypothetical protein
MQGRRGVSIVRQADPAYCACPGLTQLAAHAGGENVKNNQGT